MHRTLLLSIVSFLLLVSMSGCDEKEDPNKKLANERGRQINDLSNNNQSLRKELTELENQIKSKDATIQAMTETNKQMSEAMKGNPSYILYNTIGYVVWTVAICGIIIVGIKVAKPLIVKYMDSKATYSQYFDCDQELQKCKASLAEITKEKEEIYKQMVNLRNAK